MSTASGSLPSAPHVKLKDTIPNAPKKRKNLPSSDGTDPPLPSNTEDGGEFQEVTSRRANKTRPERDRMSADNQTGTSTKPLFSSVYVEASDNRRLNDFAIARALRQGKIEFVKVVSKGVSQVLIHFNSKIEAESFSNNQVFLQSIKCTSKLSQGAPDRIKGVVRGKSILTLQKLR
jgi:hypothetical protein